MNKQLFSAIAIVCLLITACRKVEKDVHDYYAKVKITEAKAMPDGSLELTGEVDPGRHGLHYAGFCLDSMPHPGLVTNQVIIEGDMISDNRFKLVYKGLNSAPTYYVRGWASNENGYTMTDDIAVSNLGLDTNIIPCKLAPETMVINLQGNIDTEPVYSVDDPRDGFHWVLDVDCNSTSLSFVFKRKPVTGIYTVASGDADGNYIELYYNRSGLGQTRAKPDSKVYVRQLPGNMLEISMCDAPMHNFLRVSARFVCKRD